MYLIAVYVLRQRAPVMEPSSFLYPHIRTNYVLLVWNLNLYSVQRFNYPDFSPTAQGDKV